MPATSRGLDYVLYHGVLDLSVPSVTRRAIHSFFEFGRFADGLLLKVLAAVCFINLNQMTPVLEAESCRLHLLRTRKCCSLQRYLFAEIWWRKFL